MTGGEQLELAAAVLDRVRATAGPQVQAQAFVSRTSLALTRFADSAIHQNVADESTVIRLTVHRDGRTGRATGSLVSPDGLAGLVDRALAAAAACPPDPTWPGLTPPTPVPAGGAPDQHLIQADPADRVRQVAAFIDAAAGLPTAGYCRVQHCLAGYANTTGHWAQASTADMAVAGIARTPTSDGAARLCTTSVEALDAAALGTRAAAKARAGAEPVTIEPGRYEVVLEPAAVDDILRLLGGFGFNGKLTTEHRSFLRLGATQFDPSITVVDAGTAPDRFGLPFDEEGTPKLAVELIGAGVSRTAVYDRRVAALAGCVSTGHGAERTRASGPEPALLSLLPAPVPAEAGPAAAPRVEPGGAGPISPAADASVLTLVRQVRRGLLVSDHWYTRVLDPKVLSVTGLTRNGVWLIENGEIVGPVRNLRFTQAYPQALAPGQVLGVGTRTHDLPTNYEPTAARAPALHLAAWNFTS
jgi:predicted Zn-dependent protease